MPKRGQRTVRSAVDSAPIDQYVVVPHERCVSQHGLYLLLGLADEVRLWGECSARISAHLVIASDDELVFVRESSEPLVEALHTTLTILVIRIIATAL